MINFENMLGYTNNAYIYEVDYFNKASNIYVTDNPTYSTTTDFLAVYPQFTPNSVNHITQDLLTMFYTVADAAIKEARYKNTWKYLMNLYIAHLCTLYIESYAPNGAEAEAIFNKAMPRGVASSKTVDGLSISYDFMDASSDMAGYGTFKYTIFGQQLITMVKMYRGTGIWVNG